MLLEPSRSAATDTLVVVEVKTGRAGKRFRPGGRLESRALARRWSAARALAEGRAFRVDLVEVQVHRGAPPLLVQHRGIRTPPREASG